MINAKLLVSKAFGPVDDEPVRRQDQEVKTNELPAEAAPASRIRAVGTPGAGYSKATIQLAKDMADHHDLLKDLLKHMRTVISGSNKTFYYDMSHKSPEEQEDILAIVFRMRALIANLFYNADTHLLQGQIADVPAVINFLNGRYLEVAVTE